MEEKEVVINKCYGGFSLSVEGVRKYAKLAGLKLFAYTNKRSEGGGLDFTTYIRLGAKDIERSHLVYWVIADAGPTIPSDDLPEMFHDRDIKRDDPHLIETVKKLKTKANGDCAKLSIISIPVGVEFEIGEYDGMEWVAEVHRTWG